MVLRPGGKKGKSAMSKAYVGLVAPEGEAPSFVTFGADPESVEQETRRVAAVWARNGTMLWAVQEVVAAGVVEEGDDAEE